MKRCKLCGQTKPLSEFYLATARKNGKKYPMYCCKDCNRERIAKRYREDPAFAAMKRKSIRVWQKENREHLNEQARERHAKRRPLDIRFSLGKLISTKRYQCKKWDIPFDLTVDEIVTMYEEQGGKCALTGRELLWGQAGWTRDGISIDRIEASLGYVHGNVRLVTLQVNRARSDMSDDELLDLAYAVINTATYSREKLRAKLRVVK